MDIARAQDAEVGDGTTSVVILAGQLLKEVKGFIEEGVNPQVIIRGYRTACQLAVNRVKEIAVQIDKSSETYVRSINEFCLRFQRIQRSS